jgi:hypothetical protein
MILKEEHKRNKKLLEIASINEDISSGHSRTLLRKLDLGHVGYDEFTNQVIAQSAKFSKKGDDS